MARLSFRCPDELLARVDRARQTPVGTVPRETWLRDVVILAAQRAEAAAAAERVPRYVTEDAAIRYGHASSTQAKTGVAPRPKGGK